MKVLLVEDEKETMLCHRLLVRSLAEILVPLIVVEIPEYEELNARVMNDKMEE